LTAPPKRVETVDSHGHGLEPFFDVVPLCVIELIAQFVASEGSQIARAIDEKLGFSKRLFPVPDCLMAAIDTQPV